MTPMTLVLIVALTILVSVLFDLLFFALYLYLALPASLRVHAPLVDGLKPLEMPKSPRLLLGLPIVLLVASLLGLIALFYMMGAFR